MHHARRANQLRALAAAGDRRADRDPPLCIAKMAGYAFGSNPPSELKRAISLENAAQLRRTNSPGAGARLQDASDLRTSLDFARSPWYLHLMNRSVRIANRKHMTRFGWAVEGVAR